MPITGFPSLSSSTVFIPVNGDTCLVVFSGSVLSGSSTTLASLPSLFIRTASLPVLPSLPSLPSMPFLTPKAFLISSDDEASRSFPSLPLIPSTPFSVTPLFPSSPVNINVLPSLPSLPILIPLSGFPSSPPIFTLSNLGALLISKFILPSLLIEVARFSPLSSLAVSFEAPVTLIVEPSCN